MRRTYIAITVLCLSAASAAQNNLCYEYPPESYRIVNDRVEKVVDPKTHKTEYRNIRETLDSRKYRLIMAAEKNPGRLHVHQFFLLLRKSGNILDGRTWTCPDPSLHPVRYYCYGECDGGIISIDHNGSVNFKTQSIGIGETIDTHEGTWDIFPAKEADLPAPAPIPCPDEIASMRLDLNADNESYIKHEIESLVKPIRYVCYKSKESSAEGSTTVYYGCRFTRDTCDGYFPGWKTFGEYSSEEDAMEAYRKCRGEK